MVNTVDVEVLHKSSEEETLEYDDGFKAGYYRRPSDSKKSLAWQKGWAEAQE